MPDEQKKEDPETEEGIEEEDAEGSEDEVGLDEEEGKPIPPEEGKEWIGGHTMGGAHPSVPPPDRATI